MIVTLYPDKLGVNTEHTSRFGDLEDEVRAITVLVTSKDQEQKHEQIVKLVERVRRAEKVQAGTQIIMNEKRKRLNIIKEDLCRVDNMMTGDGRPMQRTRNMQVSQTTAMSGESSNRGSSDIKHIEAQSLVDERAHGVSQGEEAKASC